MMPVADNPMPKIPPDNVVAAWGPVGKRYTINLHHDIRRFRVFPWWASITIGIMHPENGIRHARSRDGLVAKCEKYIDKDMHSRGYDEEPVIRIEGPN